MVVKNGTVHNLNGRSISSVCANIGFATCRGDERKWKDSPLFQDSGLRLQMFHLEIGCLSNVPKFTNLNVKCAFAHSGDTYTIDLGQGSAKVQNRVISVVKWLEKPLVQPTLC